MTNLILAAALMAPAADPGDPTYGFFARTVQSLIVEGPGSGKYGTIGRAFAYHAALQYPPCHVEVARRVPDAEVGLFFRHLDRIAEWKAGK